MLDSKNRYLKVSELTTLIKETLESQFYSILVEGEISNFKAASSGHFYFSLKDGNAVISAVFFKNAAKNISFIPSDGQLVKVTGDISVYPQRGNYQIICHTIEKSGEGEILAELEQRKKQLASEGLFDENFKKKLPLMPRKIAVVTSPTGAALKDILNVLKRRNNKINIIILPTLVQGNEAAPMIAAQIRRANMLELADVIIVGRGGGSLEDLLPFSSEEVVRAIYDSEIPVISAVGHEVDVSLSDFAADLRAPTPSAAAEIVSMESSLIEEEIAELANTLEESINRKLEALSVRLNNVSPQELEKTLRKNLNQFSQWLDDVRYDIQKNIVNRLKLLKLNIKLFTNSINAASPLEILKKGYAVVSNNDNGKQIKSAFETKEGKEISIRFLNDTLKAKVVSKPQAFGEGKKEKEENE
ncbi:MAG: exodeoxyribonuclease VII large subunit [Spirochaetes bacterium]|nr:exodeoxyribonuclease VII large subunit [Spirochaetota bacterium]